MVGPRRPSLSTGVGLAGALGLNLWVLGQLVPMVSLPKTDEPRFLMAPLVLIAPALLAFGLRRRSARALLVGVPVAVFMVWLAPSLSARRNAGGFVVVALSLCAYVIAALRLLEPALPPSDAPAIAPPPSPGWTRRLRIYRGFAIVAAALPTLLVYAIDLHPSTVAALTVNFAEETERAQALMTSAAALLFAIVFTLWLRRPLASHLDHDIEVRVTAERSRLLARGGRPRPAFYIAVGCALALMATVMVLRAGAR